MKHKTNYTIQDVLNHKMQANDADAETIKDYLKALLKRLWEEGEGFSSKRPFGNSGWEGELYTALVQGEFVEGTLDGAGSVYACNYHAANVLIFKCISYVFD